MHPPHAKVAKGVPGLQFQAGRLIFHLDDGRLGELHQSKAGGDGVGPTPPVNRRRVSTKYTWSMIDAPESEGWNAEYCSEERGPLNCISGIKDELNDDETTRSGFKRRTGNKARDTYHLVSTETNLREDDYIDQERKSSLYMNFRLRVMHEGRSFFVITEGGLTYEYLNVENVWFWLQHEHHSAMKGALGNYNGSLFLVNENNDLIIRERAGNELTWMNCTGMKKGKQVIGGPPWGLSPAKSPKVTPEDSLFFISKTGTLLQLTVSRLVQLYSSKYRKSSILMNQLCLQVALRKLKWKDCKSPSNTKITGIIDQEVFRENIVFAVGRDGQLYQYNKVTSLWHKHYQSQHLVLSKQPGTAMRGSSRSLIGSLFMISEDGRLIEYHWNPMDGWSWVEHGTPCLGVTLVGSTGPCLGGNQLFLIGSNGNVYLRYWDQVTWKWSDCGFPYIGNTIGENSHEKEVCTDHEYKREPVNCDPKVGPTRPIPFTENSVIFELRDGRVKVANFIMDVFG